VTLTYLSCKAIGDGAGPVDQSLAARFIHSARHSFGASRRDDSSTTTGDQDRITPGLGCDATTGSVD